MCGSPSVGSQLWKGFLCSPATVFSSSPSQVLGVPCTGVSPPCGTLPKTFFGYCQKGDIFNKKGLIHLVVEVAHWCSWTLESNQAPCLSICRSDELVSVPVTGSFTGELFPCLYALRSLSASKTLIPFFFSSISLERITK